MWEKFRLGNLFSSFSAIKQAKSQGAIPTDNSENGVNYVVQSMYNNMVARRVNKQYLIENNEPPVSGNKIVLGVTLPAVSYQEKEFGASQVITATSEWLNKNNGIYIATLISKEMYQFSYSKKPGLQIYKDMEIEFPSINGNLALSFMENFIAELKALRVAELHAYLQATGLSNYTLSDDEQAALNAIKTAKWQIFNIVDVFDVKNTFNILSRDIVENSGNIPYLSASRENNAVASYISYDENFLDKGNCIFIGGKTFVVTYQEQDFYSNDSHNLCLYLKETEKLNKLNQFFMISCLAKGLSHQYSWGNSISNKKIQKDQFLLPIKDGKIDYEFMEIFISAIQKLVIKDVVQWADKQIEATEKVILN